MNPEWHEWLPTSFPAMPVGQELIVHPIVPPLEGHCYPQNASSLNYVVMDASIQNFEQVRVQNRATSTCIPVLIVFYHLQSVTGASEGNGLQVAHIPKKRKYTARAPRAPAKKYLLDGFTDEMIIRRTGEK